MEITPDELEKFKKEMEEQQRIGIELSQKEQEYRTLTKSGDLQLTIDWEDEISKVDLDFIKSKINIDGLDSFEENFDVVYLDLDSIVDFHCDNADEVYPKDKLWDTCRADRNITKLISHIKEGKSVCPPVIDFVYVQLTGTITFSILDGNHRIALSRFLGLDKIPFIVRKNNIERINQI